MTTHECVIVVRQLVPYHDARFSAAASLASISVIEVIGQSGPEWAKANRRLFPVELANLTKDEPQFESAKLIARLEELDPPCVAVQGWIDPIAITTINWAAARSRRIIMFSESNYDDTPRSPLREWFKRRVVSLCQAALVGGKGHREYMERLGMPPEAIFEGYNAVDNAHFAKAGEYRDSTRPPYFLAASRLIPIKNLSTAIAAYALYANASKSDPWKFHVIGTGPDASALQQQAETRGLGALVSFLGFRRYEELPRLYGEAGAFIHPAETEPWGLVVNEAMAAGTPVIASDRCGSARQLIRHGENGFVFQPKSAGELAQLMRMVSDDPELRGRVAAAAQATIACWGPDRFGAAFRQALDFALSQRLRPSLSGRLSTYMVARS